MTTQALPLPQAFARVSMVVAVLLLIPAVAMQLGTDVDWGPGDFVAAAVLLHVAGAGWILAGRIARTPGQRIAIASAVGLVVAVVWAELAVGVFT